MAIDFSKVNLEVIDLNTNANPDLYVNRNGITFSKRILEDLNSPQNVQYAIDPTQHIFAVRVCKSNESKAAGFSKARNEQNFAFTCGNKNLHDLVVRMIPSYEEKKRYKVTGEYDAENRVMYFDMSTAEGFSFRASGK